METPGQHEKVFARLIEDEMRDSFLDYSMSVIVQRALPDVRDGLKPVHRRILYAMSGLGLGPGRPYKKSATVVGEVLGKYHPHGDMAVYDALVRMVQDFSLRYPLVDGQGNFGSIDGDSAAAYRYTETRLAHIASEMLEDIDKETVRFIPNFDDRLEEPTVLPAKLPNLLVNGAAGIAVGMATNIPPHNLREVVDAVVQLIDDPDATVVDLMQHVQGPDFPTGAYLHGRDAIREAYETGRGRLVMRADAEIEMDDDGEARIIVREIPFMVNKSRMIEQIAGLVREKKVTEIRDLRDESDRDGMRIVVELKRDAIPTIVLNQLFKHTQMQSTFGAIMLALVDGQPKVMNLKEMLQHFIDHRHDVVVKRSEHDLAQALDREHILEGLAKAILDMRLARLTGLEIEKLENELTEVRATIEDLRDILGSQQRRFTIIKDELRAVADKYGDDRRTKIVGETSDLSLEDLIPDERMVVTISHEGYVKRLPLDTYRTQRRGGRGLQGMITKDGDWVEHLFLAHTHDYLMVFTRRGHCYWLKVHQIPQAGRNARGRPMINLLALDASEQVAAVVPVREFTDDRWLVFATRKGTVKKTALSRYGNIRVTGVNAINIGEDDELIDVRITEGDDQVLLATHEGMAIRFHESDVREMGRATTGVRGIRLGAKDDYVVGMVVARKGTNGSGTLLVITEKGRGKRSRIDDYRLQGRGGKGVINIKTTSATGRVIAIKGVQPDDELMVITRNGVVNRQPVDQIRVIGRNTQGVRIVALDDGDQVMDVARLVSEKDEDELDDADQPAAGPRGDGVGDAAPADVMPEDDPEDEYEPEDEPAPAEERDE
ncbi:MAG: DNA gyrase subunit A [Gemmatimonadota bacterium]